MNYRIYIFLFVFALSSGCSEDFFETTLEIDPPEHVESLAVHAFGNTRTNQMHVLISKTVGLLDELDQSQIVGASVSLFKGDDLIYQLDPISNQRYNYIMPEGVYVFEKGQTYRLEVEAENYPTATAVALVPLDVNPISLSFEEEAGSDFDGNEASAINISFQDDPDKADYYEAYGLYGFQSGSNFEYNWRWTDSFDPSTVYGIDNLLFSDDVFNGIQKTLELIIDRIDTVNNPDETDKIYLNWRIVSRDHFLFNKTTRSFLDNGENPFSSPIQIYSNIENGIGLFSIVNESFLKVD